MPYVLYLLYIGEFYLFNVKNNINIAISEGILDINKCRYL